MNQAPPENCPQAVFDAVLDTPEPDKWIDCGKIHPLPMFHMHTMMKYGEKCAFTAVTHGVKMEWRSIETAPQDGSMFLVWIDGVRFGEDDDGNPYQHAEAQVDFAQWRDYGEHGKGLDCFGDPYPYDQWGATHWMPLPPPPKEQA